MISFNFISVSNLTGLNINDMLLMYHQIEQNTKHNIPIVYQLGIASQFYCEHIIGSHHQLQKCLGTIPMTMLDWWMVAHWEMGMNNNV